MRLMHLLFCVSFLDCYNMCNEGMCNETRKFPRKNVRFSKSSFEKM